ncbi:putative secreted protein (Por secretion system target) [Chitinophaga skermanii]|uniref:Putative secreted protein (Por secretion system target) n=1 Tax=Chitinophaga skermanii TaxID=331697 RepID=A0A327QF26_9BACT|nr:M43 family zinc metalloprotease [Chitinophaga skermanii]RAJ02222.1 putative secreted protein (Por secretion system target) [Chitinophaga skermanii]
MLQLSTRVIVQWLCFGLCFCCTVVSGQQLSPEHCGATRAMESLYRKHPASKKAALLEEVKTKAFVQEREAKRWAKTALASQTFVIPVVFHVNDPVNPYKVTLEQVQSAINILNQDYSLTNADASTIDARFSGLAANVNIQFRLAEIDPQGNPTTGVTYHFNDLDGRAPDGTGSAVKSISYWPGEKYLNIWVVSEVEQKGVYNNSGWAYLPDNWVATNHLDGIVYNWRYLGAPGIGSSEAGSAYMKRVLTHEVGHFLNLWHAFDNECNAPGDYVDDTPPTKSNYGGCNVNANWCGVTANVENYMDYSNCPKMFTTGQADRMIAALNSSVAARNNLWSAANLAATLLPANTKRLIPKFNIFSESDVNNGSFNEVDTLKLLYGAKFTASSGSFTQGTHFTVANLPSGLTASIQLMNDSVATLRFNGAASNHVVLNNTDSVKITMLNAAIVGGASVLYKPGITLSLRFINPYKIVYNDIADFTISANNVWTYFSLGVGDAAYGGWFNANKLRLETYQKAAISVGSTRNIRLINAGANISDTSNFIAGGAYPDEHDIYSSSYTAWAGKTGYVGIRFTVGGKYRYGWLRISVAANGSSYTIKDYAYNETPNANIVAGNAGAPTLSWSKLAFRESLVNDGALGDTAELHVLGASFVVPSGNLTSGTHYTISNVPSGLTAVVKVINGNTAQLYFTGKATAHATSNNANVSIQLLPSAFSGGIAVDSASKQLAVNFRNPYLVKYVDVNDTTFTIHTTSNWYYFLVDNIATAAYGMWADSGKLRLETYTKPMVCVGNTRNIALLGANVNISDTSNFVAGGDYPYEHELVTNSYTAWKGQTGYAGFSFNIGDEKYYGWFRFKVNAAGTSYSLMDYAYNTQPNGALKTGQSSTPIDTSTQSAYCTASTALDYNTITRVRFANLDKTSSWNGYSDFTTSIATVTAGQSYSLEVNLNVEYWPDIAVGAWIDWNNNKQFETSERVYYKRGSGPFTASIPVPANAAIGNTRMRVRMGYGQDISACGVDNYQGEVEDYTVKVNAGSPGMQAPVEGLYTALKANSPFEQTLQIQYVSKQNGPGIVRLYNIKGVLVYTEKVNTVKGANLFSLHDVGSLPSGVYVLEIVSKFDINRIKVVKQ